MFFFSASSCLHPYLTLPSLYIHLTPIVFSGSTCIHFILFYPFSPVAFSCILFSRTLFSSFFSIPLPPTYLLGYLSISFCILIFIILAVPAPDPFNRKKQLITTFSWLQTFFNCPAMGSVTSKFCVYHITAPGQEQRTQII